MKRSSQMVFLVVVVGLALAMTTYGTHTAEESKRRLCKQVIRSHRNDVLPRFRLAEAGGIPGIERKDIRLTAFRERLNFALIEAACVAVPEIKHRFRRIERKLRYFEYLGEENRNHPTPWRPKYEFDA